MFEFEFIGLAFSVLFFGAMVNKNPRASSR